MIYYLTYNEPFNGIYNSQVLDVVKHLRVAHKVNVRLIALLPIGFNFSNFHILKNKLKQIEPTSIIIPTLPIQYGWKFNWILLTLALFFKRKGSVISREIFATYIALKCKKLFLLNKVCHDGRGASLAQMLEYNVYPDKLKKDILKVEPYSVNNADFRLAVSNGLFKYWKENFNYTSEKHVVIPCTISTDYFNISINQQEIDAIRHKYNFKTSDVILVFSGSSFGWQSLDIISKFCEMHIKNDDNVKVMFLSKLDDAIVGLQNQFPGKIFCKWLAVEEVIPFLMACDYGLLLRESNNTNNVASPTKFAEYLAAGLQVIISDNLEFSTIVNKYKCGEIVNNKNLSHIDLKSISIVQKEKNREVAKEYFLKYSELNYKSYETILNNIS